MILGNNEALCIGDGRAWHFVNGQWQDGQDNMLTVPDDLRSTDGGGMQGHHYAFHLDSCYQDAQVSFEYCSIAHSDAGIILRASDPSHLYLLHFPDCGQASRSKNFWAAFSRMDESGYLKIIKLELIRRVSTVRGRWHDVAIALDGNKISVEIDRHGRFEAQDDTISDPGRLGLYCFSDAKIRNVRIKGQMVESSPWQNNVQPRTNWFHPCPDTRYGRWQFPMDLLQFPDGEVLLNLFCNPEHPFHGKRTPILARSADDGRTWSTPEMLNIGEAELAKYGTGRLHLTPKGRLICLLKLQTEDGYFMAESKDRGRTWSQSVPAGIATPPKIKQLHQGPQALLNLADGSMLMFCYGMHDLRAPDLKMYTWGCCHSQAFAYHSKDDGRSWSAAVNIDNPGCDKEGKQYDGNLDLTEVCGIQMSDGRIMTLTRPEYSPWMWESWSEDGGASWGSCVRGPFPGYATPNMLRTTSGAVLVAHRLPGLTIHCSWDEGRTWDQGTMIDSSIWAMGSMIEVYPDLVLYVYCDSFGSLMRAQLIRVTTSGLEPIGAD